MKGVDQIHIIIHKSNGNEINKVQQSVSILILSVIALTTFRLVKSCDKAPNLTERTSN